MVDLLAFLKARLDEDEQAARAAAEETGNPVWEYSGSDVIAEQTGYPGGITYVAVAPWDGDVPAPVGNHIARHDPARVLREVEAKRRILTRYEFVSSHGPAVDHTRAMDMTTGAQSALRDALRMLALPYTGHEDYREAWRL
jgi:hypothetical protein